MLDKSIKHIGVLMYSFNNFNDLKIEPIENIRIVGYSNAFKEPWCKIQVELEQFDSISEAREYFRNEFEGREPELVNKMFFAINQENQIVGTACLWDGRHFGRTLPRLHWIAVSEAYQGRGIAKLLVSKLIDLYKLGNQSEFIYLTTQTWSYKAIDIYIKIGFEPYLKNKPENWSGNEEMFEQNNKEAWDLIELMLERYKIPVNHPAEAV